MGLNVIGTEDFQNRVRNFAVRLLNIGSACTIAKSELALDRHDQLVHLPDILMRFKVAADSLQAEGHNLQTIGPILDTISGTSGINWVTEDGNYQTLRTAGVALYSTITNNGTLLLHNFDSSGQRVYDEPLTAGQKAAIDADLDAVLALF